MKLEKREEISEGFDIYAHTLVAGETAAPQEKLLQSDVDKVLELLTEQILNIKF